MSHFTAYFLAIKALFHSLPQYQSLLKENNININIVMGNAASDLDSTLTPLLLTYLRNYQEDNFIVKEEKVYNNLPWDNLYLKNFDEILKAKPKNVYLPIINCKKGELFYRLEIKLLMEHYNIKEEDLVYFDDVAWYNNDKGDSDKSLNDYKLIIVDHHELDYDQVFLKNLVTEIFDHHSDTLFDFSEYKNLKLKRNIFPRCSAFSVVLEEVFNEVSTKYQNPESKKIFLDHLLGKTQGQYIKEHNPFVDLLVSTQLVDSNNFLKSNLMAKWVQLDLELVLNVLLRSQNSLLLRTHNSDKKDLQRFKESLEKKAFYKKYSSEIIEDNNSDSDGEDDAGLVMDCLHSILKQAKKDKKSNLDLGIPALFSKDRKSYIVETQKSDGSSVNAKIMLSSIPVGADKIIEVYSEKELYEHAVSSCHDHKADAVIFKSKIKNKQGVKENHLTHYFSEKSQLCLDTKKRDQYIEHLKNVFQEDLYDVAYIEKYNMFDVTLHRFVSRKLFWPEVRKFFLNNKF